MLIALLSLFVILKVADIVLTLIGINRGLAEANPLFGNARRLFTVSFVLIMAVIFSCLCLRRLSYGMAVVLAAIACGWAAFIDIRNYDLIRRKR